MSGPLDYLDSLNFNTKHFQKFSQIVETFPATDRPDVKVAVCRCWQSKKFPYCDGTHKLLMENGDNVGPYVAILKAPKTARNNVVRIQHPLASKNRNYVAKPVKSPAKVAAFATLISVPALYFIYKKNIFNDILKPKDPELAH